MKVIFLIRAIFLTRDRAGISCVSYIGRQILYQQCHLGGPCIKHTHRNTHTHTLVVLLLWRE